MRRERLAQVSQPGGEAIAFSRPREICVKPWHFRAQTGTSGNAYAHLTAPEHSCGNKRNPVCDWISLEMPDAGFEPATSCLVRLHIFTQTRCCICFSGSTIGSTGQIRVKSRQGQPHHAIAAPPPQPPPRVRAPSQQRPQPPGSRGLGGAEEDRQQGGGQAGDRFLTVHMTEYPIKRPAPYGWGLSQEVHAHLFIGFEALFSLASPCIGNPLFAKKPG